MEKEQGKSEVEQQEEKEGIDQLCEQLNDFCTKIFKNVDYLKKRIDTQEMVIAKQGDKILELEARLREHTKADKNSGIVLLNR